MLSRELLEETAKNTKSTMRKKKKRAPDRTASAKLWEVLNMDMGVLQNENKESEILCHVEYVVIRVNSTSKCVGDLVFQRSSSGKQVLVVPEYSGRLLTLKPFIRVTV